MQTLRADVDDRLFIAACTADAMAGDAQKYLDLAFDAYLSKPVDIGVLTDILRQHTEGSGLTV